MLSTFFLIKQQNCCGHGCVKCPYIPKHSGQSNKLDIDILKNLEEWELEELKKNNIIFDSEKISK